MLRIHHCCVRVAACVAVSRVIKPFVLSATWCVSIFAPVIGTSLVLTAAAVAGPTPAPTTTPTAAGLLATASPVPTDTPTAAPIVSGQTKPGFEIESAQSAQSASASSSSLTVGSNVNISQLGGNHRDIVKCCGTDLIKQRSSVPPECHSRWAFHRGTSCLRA
jgi:hypothetical protein